MQKVSRFLEIIFRQEWRFSEVRETFLKQIGRFRWELIYTFTILGVFLLTLYIFNSFLFPEKAVENLYAFPRWQEGSDELQATISPLYDWDKQISLWFSKGVKSIDSLEKFTSILEDSFKRLSALDSLKPKKTQLIALNYSLEDLVYQSGLDLRDRESLAEFLADDSRVERAFEQEKIFHSLGRISTLLDHIYATDARCRLIYAVLHIDNGNCNLDFAKAMANPENIADEEIANAVKEVNELFSYIVSHGKLPE